MEEYNQLTSTTCRSGNSETPEASATYHCLGGPTRADGSWHDILRYKSNLYETHGSIPRSSQCHYSDIIISDNMIVFCTSAKVLTGRCAYIFYE